MNRAEPDLGPAFAAAAGASRERAPEHADLEALTGYLHGSLPEADAEALREHLTGCRECGELLLEIEAFESDVAAAAVDDAAVDDLEEAASWRAARAEIDSVAGGGDSAAGNGSGWRVWRASAAVLTAALLGSVGWAVYERGENAELTAPQPNLRIVELMRKGVTRGSTSESPEVFEVPPDDRFALIIAPEFPAPGGLYLVQIEDRENSRIWSGQLVSDEHGYLSLGLSRRHLRGAEYTVQVLPLDNREETKVETFLLRFSR